MKPSEFHPLITSVNILEGGEAIVVHYEPELNGSNSHMLTADFVRTGLSQLRKEHDVCIADFHEYKLLIKEQCECEPDADD